MQVIECGEDESSKSRLQSSAGEIWKSVMELKGEICLLRLVGGESGYNQRRRRKTPLILECLC